MPLSFTSEEIGLLIITAILLTATAVLWTVVRGGHDSWLSITVIFSCIVALFFIRDGIAGHLHGNTLYLLLAISAILFSVEIFADFGKSAPLVPWRDYFDVKYESVMYIAVCTARTIRTAMGQTKNDYQCEVDIADVPKRLLSDFIGEINVELSAHGLKWTERKRTETGGMLLTVKRLSPVKEKETSASLGG